MREKINVKTGGKLYIAGEYSILTAGQSAIIKNINNNSELLNSLRLCKLCPQFK